MILSLTVAKCALVSISSVLAQFQQVPTEAWRGQDPAPFPQAAPNSVRLSAEALDRAGEIAADGGSESLLIVRNGKLIYEEYWDGKKRSDVQQMYSATKSPFSFLVGRAIETGHVKGLDQPIIDFVPEIAGEGREQLTFRNIMAMESGLNQSRELDGRDAKAGHSQLDIVLLRSVAHKPFEWYHYNNVGYRLLFTALERATGKSIPEFTRDELFAPLSMHGAYWVDLVTTGKHMGYQSIRMRPIDLLKVAQIMLDGGKWKGEQYLPKSYIEELTEAPGPKANPSYGLFWHLNEGDFYRTFYESDRVEGQLMPGTPDDAIINYGSRGQLIVAIPSLDLAWVRTGPNIPSTLWQKDSFVTQLSATIVSAVSDEATASNDVDWLAYGGNEQGHKYSSLDQINRENVSNLEVVWTHNHGDIERDDFKMIAYETTPLSFEGKLYFTTPFGRVHCIDGKTGKDLWSFTPEYDVLSALKGWPVNRG
ncbi:MAG: serine hydrolase, partial [Candidatus Hydrogenedentota bacterium]